MEAKKPRKRRLKIVGGKVIKPIVSAKPGEQPKQYRKVVYITAYASMQMAMAAL